MFGTQVICSYVAKLLGSSFNRRNADGKGSLLRLYRDRRNCHSEHQDWLEESNLFRRQLSDYYLALAKIGCEKTSVIRLVEVVVRKLGNNPTVATIGGQLS